MKQLGERTLQSGARSYCEVAESPIIKGSLGSTPRASMLRNLLQVQGSLLSIPINSLFAGDMSKLEVHNYVLIWRVFKI